MNLCLTPFLKDKLNNYEPKIYGTYINNTKNIAGPVKLLNFTYGRYNILN